MRTAAGLAFATAAAYLGTGALFFADPSRNEPAGSGAYWEILAGAPTGRTAFVAAFALTGLFALGVLEGIGHLVDARRTGVVRYGLILAYLGYSVNTVGYVRLLGGEARRAEAFADGSAATREAIQSSSLVLDPDGWLTFGAVGVFLMVVNVAAMRRSAWPLWLSLVGALAAVASWVAMVGLVIDSDILLSIAAGLGGVVLGPIWWIGIGLQLWTNALLPENQRSHVIEGHRRSDHVTPATE